MCQWSVVEETKSSEEGEKGESSSSCTLKAIRSSMCVLQSSSRQESEIVREMNSATTRSALVLDTVTEKPMNTTNTS